MKVIEEGTTQMWADLIAAMVEKQQTDGIGRNDVVDASQYRNSD